MKNRSKSESRTKKLQKIGFTKQVEKLRKDYNNSNRFKEIKHIEKSKSLKYVNRSQLAKDSGKFLNPTRIISVSAPKWAVFDYFSSKYIRGYRAHDPHELSVFSKLLVFATINALLVKNKVDSSRFQTIVTPTVLKFYPRCALKVDDIVTLEHLIHLLLMEDGEEYQLIAAINIGAYLLKKRNKEYYSVYDTDEKMYKTHMAQFYEFVNSYCLTMKLENIKYIEADPVRRKQFNRGTAFDISVLTSECLKIPLFQQILKLESKQIQVKYIDEEGTLQIKNMQLFNKTVTNKYISYFNVCRNWGDNNFMSSHCSVYYEAVGVQPIVVVLFGCYGPHDREKDIQQIIQWYLKTNLKDKDKQAQANKLKQKQSKEKHTDQEQKQKVITDKQPKEKEENLQKQYQQVKGGESLLPREKSLDLNQKRAMKHRLKTEQSKYLQSLMEQKLKGKDKGFKVKTFVNNSVRLNTDYKF